MKKNKLQKIHSKTKNYSNFLFLKCFICDSRRVQWWCIGLHPVCFSEVLVGFIVCDGETGRARSGGGRGLELVGGTAGEGGGEAAGGGILYPGHRRHRGEVQELEGEDATCGAALW